jgi:hypothetical protein
MSAIATEQDKGAESNDEKSKQQRSIDVTTLDGYLNEGELKQQFEKVVNSGIDTSQPYKWEFRFTSTIMSNLENFAQIAHSLEFWPVALESDVIGDKYWLYIQKTHQYDEEDFVKEITQLFKMAAYANLDAFDGFSIERSAAAADQQ